MPVYMNKPEFALKRAEEFLDVGKRARALEALTEAIKNRKHRIWQKSHEDIMRKFIHLCVELKQSQTAKEGLHQYKNLTANVNPKSLEDIIRYYLKLSETKCDEAREKANVQAATTAVNVVDVDDLDLAESPEGMLLKVVSTDTSQDRADRVVLLPWVRFNWEAYRHCLDLLRNLSKLESLYHDIASQAFKFCLKYGRKTELRKLCEMLRNHIGQISKREVVTPNAINLNNPETQELNLRTRLVQLDHAIAMEMWQEAFRAIEDVHGLMSMLKKVPKAALKANYFEKLALVFLRAGNAVFHAAAQQQLFILYRSFRKEQTQDELRRLAVSVLFATLAVPLQPPRTQLESLLEFDDSAASKMKQLTLLVGYTQPPSRIKLVEDLQKHGILQYVRPELQALYQQLEVSFDPLHMGANIAEILSIVNNTDELSFVRHYIKVIEEVAVGKHLRQLAQVYDSVEIDRVIQMMPYTSWHTIERVAIETARNTDLEVRIDHRRPGLFMFGSEVALAPYEAPVGGNSESTESQIPTDRVRSQLVMLLTGLTRISREVKDQQEQVEEKVLRGNLFELYRKYATRDLLSNLSRPQKSDSRQKSLEDREREKEQQAKAAKKNKDKESAAVEAQRMQRDTKQFEEQRTKLREKELEKQVIKEKIEKLKQTEFGMRVLKELEDWENVDVKELDRLEQRHREEMRREEEENSQRLKVQEKKIDHIVRAKQLEEMELRRQDNEAMIDNFHDIWTRDVERRLQMLRDDREFLLKKREKMKDMKEDYQKFMVELQQRKRETYDEKMSSWQTLFEEQRNKRLSDRRKKREEDRRETYERQQREEAEQREMEEAQRRAEEEAARKKTEQEAHQRKLDEQLRKRQEVEDRIDREESERSMHITKPPVTHREREVEREPVQIPAPASGKYVPPGQRVPAAASGQLAQPPKPTIVRGTGENIPTGPSAGRNFDSLRGEVPGPRDQAHGNRGYGHNESRSFAGPGGPRDFGQSGLDGGRLDNMRAGSDRMREDRRDMDRGQPDREIKRQGADVPSQWR